MQLHISPNCVISDIQKEFNQAFPYLKLEFFSKTALATGDYSASNLVPGNRKIGDIQSMIIYGEIEFSGTMKVKELEDRLKNDFNVAAQVFRKSGKLWLETTMTDSWTLDRQSNHAKELSLEITYDTTIKDYDLDRDATH